ncbi:aminodeoxychorismate synthase component I [Desulfotalea psychrophila]|uniref:Probable para-aminobenzoate synthase, component I n=1 Tax=Desulfotalea psychrophila (strain LSv54 / DSM 12343) TaxID=177439 RepID=Q6APW8_DESPS|nr:aminodeoxychorismate synthase component I [Desulfotalea psychrophila]CAG35605.1 probable para-aminobenzoate synthase, component I [Desulfotalea psychrophila LSv54]
MQEFIKQANSYGKAGTPFLFLLDFELQKPIILPLSKTAEQGVFYQVGTEKNFTPETTEKNLRLDIAPMNYQTYQERFKIVEENILAGNSYLLNLTFPTEIATNFSLKEIFNFAQAEYKLYFKDQFILFSPECFIKTAQNSIYSYPMKGTIDADIEGAEAIILADQKEEWEHNTIVDLIRNDLAMVARDISVNRFRFISTIKSIKKNLLQVSSEIEGNLGPDWQTGIGRIIATLLPAGSISGAPKQKTLEIIGQAEGQDRGYFTGVFGIFDGENINSAVNIRFIERGEGGLQFRSGGGITANSLPKNEYNEMVDKVYVPTC